MDSSSLSNRRATPLFSKDTDARDRAPAVRRAWLVSSFVYGLALAAFVPRELASAD